MNRTGSTVSACAYTFDPASTPQIGSISVSGDRRTATLSGKLLQNASDSNSAAIFVGDAPCKNVVLAGVNSVSCALPIGTAVAGVLASVTGYTVLGTINATGVSYTPPLVLTSLSVTNGSAAGGTLVIITGSGFSVGNASENRVFVGSASLGPLVNTSAFVMNATSTQFGATLAIVMPPAPASIFRGGNVSSAAVDISVWVQTTGSSAIARATLVAAFSYSTLLTPAITSAFPLTGSAGTLLSISGRGLGGATGSAAPVVTVGGSPCAVDIASSNATFVSCVFTNPPSGSFPILVDVPGYGLATQAPGGQSMFTSTLVVTSLSRYVFGLGGGTPLTIFGSGFIVSPGSASGSPVYGVQSVTICNVPCAVTAATSTSLTCMTGPLVTQAAIAENNVWQATVLSPAVAALSPLLVTAFDGDVGTGSSACTATIDLGATTRGIVTEVFFFPTLGRANNLAGATFAGSVDAAAWTVLAIAPAAPHSGWNSITLLDDVAPDFNFSQAPSYRFLRMTFAAGVSSCSFQELAWIGYAVAVVPPTGDCPVYVAITGPSEPRAVLAGITPALASGPPATVTVQLSQSVQYSLESE